MAEKGKKKHLHSIRTEQAEDGSYVHHHSYKGNKDDPHPEPERMNVATSGDADEAGQHVADQFGQNAGAAAPQAGGDQEAGGEPAEPGEAGQEPTMA